MDRIRVQGLRDLESRVQEFRVYLEVRSTYNLLSNCSYNPIISRVPVVMRLVIGIIKLQLQSRL